MTNKEAKHMGQQPLISEYDTHTDPKRPRGMPPFSAIASQAAMMGLPESDAQFLDDYWLGNGFKTGRNPVKDWRAVMRVWFRGKYFPSQKAAKGQPGELMTNDILDALAANPAYKKISVQAEAWKFKEWCERTGNKPLVTSFIKSLNAKL